MKILRKFWGQPEKSWHEDFVQHVAQVLSPNVYAELGIYQAETFNPIRAKYKIAVDIDPRSLEFVIDSPATRKICGDSTALSEYLHSSKILVDMLFIDADHQKDSVIRDFTKLEKHMSEIGVVLFHDTFPQSVEMSSPKYCGDGYLAIADLRDRFRYWNFITLPVHPGLTLASRVDCVPPWSKTKYV